MPGSLNTRWQMLDQRISGKPLPTGLDAFWDKGTGYAKRLVQKTSKYLKRSEEILALEKKFLNLTDAKLRSKSNELRDRFRRNQDTPCDLNEAFALVREVAARKIGEKPFPVQIAGALALANGCVAEMATGEGKTLTASLVATVAGWQGKGCHIITVNDYLANRDAEWIGPIYRFCGLTVAHIEQGMEQLARREAYDADITYCTNKEVAADFLRDRLAMGNLRGVASVLLNKFLHGSGVIDKLVQRGLNFALVDEADSILIDEAVTPLIISGNGTNTEQTDAILQAAEVASFFCPRLHYTCDRRYREIELTVEGREKVHELSKKLGAFWKGTHRREEVVLQALTAKEFYLCDKHYIIDDGKVVIVDEFTGRLMPDRTWRDGLHQAIEAKEKLRVNPPKDTLARISFQRFFRIYKRLAGMTGTAKEASNEFWQIYHLPVVTIPTDKPCIRRIQPTIVLSTEAEKWEVILEEIVRINKTGKPILVGTRSIRASEYLSNLLKTRNLEHQVLNAIHHRQEAEIVAGAGQRGKITVATNMAGRGTDIKLGRGAAELGGLHVLATELNESARIDRQLFGRGARQGDPGSAQAIISLQDEYVSRYTAYAAEILRKHRNSTYPKIWEILSCKLFDVAQLRAERLALRQRKSVLKTDHWLDEKLGFAGSE
jgi:preprotein translocase subunit SecA